MMSDQLKILYKKSSQLYQNYQYDEALAVINSLSKKDKNTLSFRSLKSCILIDRWNGESNTKHEIIEAINHLKILLEKDNKNQYHYLYNLGNAYQKIAASDLIKNKRNLNPEIILNLEKAKSQFEKSIQIEDNQPEVWINLGNTLNYLGRYLEGIECYDNAIVRNPTHYNAWAARGTCCWHLSNFVSNEEDKKLLMHHAMVFLKLDFTFNLDIPRDPALKKIVETYFKRNKSKLNPKEFLKKVMPKKSAVLGENFNLSDHSPKSYQEFYQVFCEKYGLFLNLHFDCSECSCKSRDLIDFRFIALIKDNQKPYELMKKWLAIRDEYKTARALLALAQYRPQEMQFLDKPRYEPDYCLNYLFNVELLQQSFVSIMNVFDKIAFLLNDYEELKLLDSKVNFWGGESIFTQTDLLEKNSWNRHLVAMDSIRKDIYGISSQDNKFKKMVDIRNYLTHRYFNLHDIIDATKITYPYGSEKTQIKNPEYHMDVHEFFKLTIVAMRNVRNLLFALSFFVEEKEKAKIKDPNEIIPTMEWEINWDNHPELKKIADDMAEEIKKAQRKLCDDVLDALKKDGYLNSE
ncbi:MAG: LA2681 family HEPN domain-containing protein [Methanoregula sp.]|uniref:LA2681 family HEPN domain-containing protein n=1 Tax=Methanoregula sp. TaxID=2052170 RepID=UPI003C73A502